MEEQAFVIDTNIFIDHLRNFSPAHTFFRSIAASETIFYSAITEAELLAGKENNNPQKREVLFLLLQKWQKIPVDNPLVATAGDISRMHGLQIPDAIIAASALYCKAVLVTRNAAHFKGVKGLVVKVPY
ncbi:type II toxin-antitoxin system VapC family toxin [Candidatus Woesearchaeota archaeon]|nr:type II toxin-antitoxin system VapC family toxin [Candidatus Woesearchaeota archaeon]